MNYFEHIARNVAPEAFGDNPDHALQQQVYERLNKAFGELSPHYDVVEKPARVGGDYYVTADYGADGKKLSMSKTALGQFVLSVLSNGGQIVGSFTMGTMPRSYVQLMVRLTPKGKEAVVSETGIDLVAPPKLKLA